MSSCCEISDTQVIPEQGEIVVALAGNPNSGKTTIFNALTGLRQKVANYPGVTVEKKTGRSKLPEDRRALMIDLPGTYSLISRSPDEKIAMEVLRGLVPGTPAPHVVVVVVDASNLQRNLYLVSQLIEMGKPLVVALNMTDIAERRGLHVSADRLANELGVPVVPIVGHKKQGIDALKHAILQAKIAPFPDWPLPGEMKAEIVAISEHLQNYPEHSRAHIAERMLIVDHTFNLYESLTDEKLKSVVAESALRLSQLGLDPMQADIEAHYQWIDRVAAGALIPACEKLNAPTILDYQQPPTLTQKADRILIHKIWGLAIFAAIMGVIFVSIFWLASPLMDGINDAVKWLSGVTTSRLPDDILKDLLTDGVFAGVGSVIVFVPQIAILFFFLAILEDSGYLARAAFLMDRMLSKVGLHGKSFIPLLSSFACAIPGIMATRTIENRRDRLATIFIAPFMSCSARLPVYALLIGTFFAGASVFVRGGIMLTMYVFGIVAAVATAWVFKRTLLKGAPSAFILELPTYKMPQASQIARQVWVNTSEFIKKAGTTIFFLSIILWALAYYPRVSDSTRTEREGYWTLRVENQEPLIGVHRQTSGSIFASGEREAMSKEFIEKKLASEQLEQSYAGRFGHFIEPAIRPLGFDWKMGVGLVGAFAAREVFVSTMAITYAAGDEDNTYDLATAMQNDRYADGRPVWTPLVAISLLVWFVIAMQCMSTLAIVRRETGGWRWPIFMLVYMNALAYVCSLIVFQVGRIWWA